MDTHTSHIPTDSLGRRGGPRRRWPEETKRRIVEETFKPGASVAIVDPGDAGCAEDAVGIAR